MGDLNLNFLTHAHVEHQNLLTMKIFKKTFKDFSNAKSIKKIQKQEKSIIKGGTGNDDLDQL